jgi:hypothetical protein
MTDTYPLGGVPPLSAREGEALTFKVTTGLGTGVTFTKLAMPSPKGKTSIDEKTGVFTYTPASEDRDEFAVWIRARKGAKNEKQQVFITPQPRLPSEFNVIEHVSSQPPEPASRLYTTVAEQDAGEFIFNPTGVGDKPVMTKKVTASGVTLIIERNEDEGSLYNRLTRVGDGKAEKGGRADLKELTLCADEIVIRCELKVPGTDVNIFARRLRFEGSGEDIGRIDTSPLAITASSDKDEGMDGQKAGDVRLYVLDLDTPGNANRIIANGGNGQAARLGKPGEDGDEVKKWDGKIRVENKDFDFAQELRELPGKGFPETPVAVSVWQEIPLQDRKKKTEKRFDQGRFPTNGKNPEVLPGRPGRGGDGGSITTQFKDQLANRVKQDAGVAGKMAADIPAAKQGKPVESLMLKFVYRMDIRGATVASFGPYDSRETTPPKEAKAPPAKTPNPNPGKFNALTGKSFWVHPTTVRALISYANDAMLAGHSKTARELLAIYLEAVKDAANKGDLVWPVLHNELAALVQRIDGPYDYFGNPAGWVPMLSFQANHQLYVNELESAIRVMFMAYWIENNQKKRKAQTDAITKVMGKMREESKRALESYEAAKKKIGYLDGQLAKIRGKLETRRKDLLGTHDRLLRETRDNMKLEYIIRASAKILGGVMQLIPVGQPVLGAFGKTAVVLGDIDLEKPANSLGGVAGAFSQVGSDVIAPKFSALFTSMKSAKEEEEKKPDQKKENFNKELEKKELEAKVKTHMEEQKKAKDTIVDAFSAFAVPEEDVQERLKKVLAQCPDYKETAAEIEKLNKEKTAFTQDLLAAVQAIDVATTTILNNQIALIELRSQLGNTLEKLNLEALQYVRGMGQRARDRLLLYQYYLVKSYHYLMLDELPSIDFRAQKMFDAFVNMVEPISKKKVNLMEDSEDGTLTADQFKLLRPVFDDQLREITRQIIDWFQKHQARSTGSELLPLTEKQLETLNGPAQSVEIDLLWLLDRQREDIRITKIELSSINLAEPLPDAAKNLSLEYLHDGLSRVRRGGKLFLFRSGEYRVAGTEGNKNQGADVSDKIAWRTDVKYNPKPKTNEEKLTWQESKLDPEAESLIRYLIGADDKGQSSMLSFRPSAWTRLTVSRSGNYSGGIDNLTLNVNYVYYGVKRDLSTVVVKVADDAKPLIHCDTLDLNKRGDSQGTFVRTFDKNLTDSVTLRAPARYGQRALLGWKNGDKFVDPSKSDPSLTLELGKSPSFLVEAVFAPTQFVPVNDKDEQWPACPVGWSFDDWVFVNRSSKALTIDRIRLNGEPAEGYTPAVNEPQGTNYVKLSFEKLALQPGESAKVSVCINPEARGALGTEHVGFMWQDGYGVYFDAGGQMNGLRKWKDNRATDVPEAFDLDRENRTIAFARP